MALPQCFAVGCGWPCIRVTCVSENSAMWSSYTAFTIDFGGTLVIRTVTFGRNAGCWHSSDLKVEKEDLRERKNHKQNLIETFLGAIPSWAVLLRLEKLCCPPFFSAAFATVCWNMSAHVLSLHIFSIRQIIYISCGNAHLHMARAGTWSEWSPGYLRAEEVSSGISFPFLTKETVALNRVTLSPSCRVDCD